MEGEAATSEKRRGCDRVMLRLGGRGLWLGLIAAAAATAMAMAAQLLGWWQPRAGFRLFIPEELARYRGGPGDPGLYLVLLGRVYDVPYGRKHYEPGSHYSGFAGIPGNSRLFPL